MMSPIVARAMMVSVLAICLCRGAWSQDLLRLEDPSLATSMRAVDRNGGWFQLEAPLESGSRGILELRSAKVFADDAVVIVHRAAGVERLDVPDNRYFRGSVVGLAGSRAFLAILESGEVRGVVAHRGRYWILAPAGSHSGDGFLTSIREVDVATELAEESRTFGCESDLLPFEQQFPPKPASDSSAAGTAGVGQPSYTARVAIETDFELYQKFGDEASAVDYIGDLFGFASGIYADEVDTTLLVSSVSLWDNAGDPYSETPGSCGLLEFGRYWNDNRTGVTRTIAHMLSGKNTNSGVAWIGVLCTGDFNWDHQGACPGLTPSSDNYGGDYGYTGGIDGNFDIGNPGLLWDIVGVAHEIGHNFNSPHTHCYEGLEGNAAAVDACYSGECGQSGCYCGSPSLPCSTPGGGCGTLMSYCHRLSGGMANLSFSFGQGHPWGVEPERVPTRMNAHVVARAGSNPSCLAFSEIGDIFADGFESGNTSEWTAVSP